MLDDAKLAAMIEGMRADAKICNERRQAIDGWCGAKTQDAAALKAAGGIPMGVRVVVEAIAIGAKTRKEIASATCLRLSTASSRCGTAKVHNLIDYVGGACNHAQWFVTDKGREYLAGLNK